MINIHTSRLFVPCPTGYTHKCRTFGIRARGYDKALYDIQCMSGNLDDISEMKDFYDVVSASYNMNLSQMPSVVPFVKYVDFMRSRGGICATDKKAIEYLKTHCNTLIITDDDERQYIEELYLNLLRRDIGLFKFNPTIIPSRFQNKVK